MALMEKAAPRFKVVTPLAILPDETQGQMYLYRDQLVPISAPVALIQHLLDSGVIRPVE